MLIFCLDFLSRSESIELLYFLLESLPTFLYLFLAETSQIHSWALINADFFMEVGPHKLSMGDARFQYFADFRAVFVEEFTRLESGQGFFATLLGVSFHFRNFWSITPVGGFEHARDGHELFLASVRLKLTALRPGKGLDALCALFSVHFYKFRQNLSQIYPKNKIPTNNALKLNMT